MFQHEELVGSSWIAAYSTVCFSCAYFAYDQLDMLRYRLYSGWIPWNSHASPFSAHLLYTGSVSECDNQLPGSHSSVRAKWRKHPTKRRGSTNRLACGRVRFSARHDRRRDAALSRWHGRHECLSSWRRWYCGPCWWGSRSARGATASWWPLPLASPSSRPPHSRPRRRIPRPALRQHRRPAPPLLSHFRLSYLCSAVPMAYKGHENMFQHEELVGSSWIGAYSALCFSCGHDAYGQLDMLRYPLYSGWIPGILMHHLILLICFALALYWNVTINCLILTLLCKTM